MSVLVPARKGKMSQLLGATYATPQTTAVRATATTTATAASQPPPLESSSSSAAVPPSHPPPASRPPPHVPPPRVPAAAPPVVVTPSVVVDELPDLSPGPPPQVSTRAPTAPSTSTYHRPSTKVLHPPRKTAFELDKALAEERRQAEQQRQQEQQQRSSFTAPPSTHDSNPVLLGVSTPHISSRREATVRVKSEPAATAAARPCRPSMSQIDADLQRRLAASSVAQPAPTTATTTRTNTRTSNTSNPAGAIAGIAASAFVPAAGAPRSNLPSSLFDGMVPSIASSQPSPTIPPLSIYTSHRYQPSSSSSTYAQPPQANRTPFTAAPQRFYSNQHSYASYPTPSSQYQPRMQSHTLPSSTPVTSMPFTPQQRAMSPRAMIDAAMRPQQQQQQQQQQYNPPAQLMHPHYQPLQQQPHQQQQVFNNFIYTGGDASSTSFASAPSSSSFGCMSIPQQSSSISGVPIFYVFDPNTREMNRLESVASMTTPLVAPSSSTSTSTQPFTVQVRQPMVISHPQAARSRDQPRPLPSAAGASSATALSDEPPPFRIDARLGGSTRLDNYFGIEQNTPLAKIKSKRQKKQTMRPAKKSSEPAVKPFFRDEDGEEEKEKEEKKQETKNNDVEVMEVDEGDDDASFSPPPEAPSGPPPSTGAMASFQRLFAPQQQGFSGRAVTYLISRHHAKDLTDTTQGEATLAEFRACIASSVEWTASIFYQDLTSNYRPTASNEQRKYIRDHFGSKKRKADEEEQVWNGGVKPPSAIVFQFFKRKENPAVPEVPLNQRVPTDIAAVNPYPFADHANHELVHLEPAGIFLLPIFSSIRLVPSSQTSSTASSSNSVSISHAWHLRQTFLDLLERPPPFLHALLFDSKSIICALMVYFRISSLSLTSLRQLSDVTTAAWLLDSDDNQNTGFSIDALLAVYHTKLRSTEGRIKLDTPGDRDIDLMLQDSIDALKLFDRLVIRMQKYGLIEPYVHQEMRVLGVVINMQIRGIAIDLSLFDIAKKRIDKKLVDLEANAHRACGRSILTSSSAQVAHALYEVLGVPEPKITEKGRSQAKQKMHATTNNSALQKIAADPHLSDPRKAAAAQLLAKSVLEHRGLFKVKTGYIEPYGRCAINDSHLLLSGASNQRRICATWQQCATGTGRLSCRNPNLQALPRANQKRASLVEAEEDEMDEMKDESDVATTGDSPMIGLARQEKSTDKPVNLPSDVNMRASIVPTPAAIVHDFFRAHLTQWNEATQSIQAPDSSFLAAITPPNESRCLLSADYNQMEVRLLAQLSQDKNLIEAFRVDAPISAAVTSSSLTAAPTPASGGDVYRRMAAIMFSKSIGEVTDSERTISKTIVLGVMYGMGAESLAARLTKFAATGAAVATGPPAATVLGPHSSTSSSSSSNSRVVSSQQAQNYILKLYEQFPKIADFMNEKKADAKTSGSVPTLMGRRRFLPGIRSEQQKTRAYAERQAVNTVIQGSAADMMKMAMINLRVRIQQDPQLDGAVAIVLQLHDEIILELPTRLLSTVAALVRHTMESVMPNSSLPFTTNIKVGAGLGDMKAIS